MVRVRTRSRNLSIPQPLGNLITYNPDGSVFSDTPQWVGGTMAGTEESFDHLNGWPHVKRGAPMNMFKSYLKDYSSDSANSGFGSQRYLGKFRPPYYSWLASVPTIESSSISAEGLGAQAYSQYKPGNPLVNSGVFLAELRDAPMLLRLRLGNLLQLGAGAYLNYQFGWKPLVSDIKRLHRTQVKLHSALEQLKRDNGKPIRRRGPVKTTFDDSTGAGTWTGYQYMMPTLPFSHHASTPVMTRKRTVTNEAWFSARFRYWIPDVGTPQWTKRATRALYGLNPTPSLLWEALPWSWLIDWFSNVGDIVNNVSENAAESLVMDYGYLMHHYKVESVYESSGTFREYGTGSFVKYTCSWTHVSEFKRRVAASPFGFGLNLGDLSTRQQAILGALGLTMS